MAVVVLLAVLWAGWHVVREEVYTTPSERQDRCNDARAQHARSPTAFSSDEVRYYCVRER